MRWVVVVGLAVGVGGCNRLNPAFGDDSDTDSGGMSGGSTDDPDSGSTGQMPGYMCLSDQFDITVTPPPLACTASGGGNVTPVTIDGECMQVRGDDGLLYASPATGCGEGVCNVLTEVETRLFVQYTHLGDAIGLQDSPECRFISAYGYPINEDEDGRCSWDVLAIWSPDGDLEIAVGNGLPDDGLPGLLGRPGHMGIVIDSTILPGNTCGNVVDGCTRHGWRAFEFGNMEKPALPDAVPMKSTWDGQEWSVVNHGLQFDRSCNRFGRWGVVRRGFEAILE